MLAKGIVINGQKIELLPRNPFLFRDMEGKEIAMTKLYIRNVPISFSNEEILTGLEKAGLKIRSKLDMERIRGPDGKLTNWVTGGRIAWIEVPKEPVSPMIDCGLFKAKIYYKEMVREIECRRCLGKGHVVKNCTNEERCRGCKAIGHRVAECTLKNDIGGIEKNVSEGKEEKVIRKNKGWTMVRGEEKDLEGENSENKCSEESNESGKTIEDDEAEEGFKVVKRKKGSVSRSSRRKRHGKEKNKNNEADESEESSSQDEDHDGVRDDKKKFEIDPKMSDEEKIEKKGRGRQMLKEVRPKNTMDRYVSRSESRKRTKSPEDEVKRQRVRLEEDDRRH